MNHLTGVGARDQGARLLGEAMGMPHDLFRTAR
jgi:hypothetical protein